MENQNELRVSGKISFIKRLDHMLVISLTSHSTRYSQAKKEMLSHINAPTILFFDNVDLDAIEKKFKARDRVCIEGSISTQRKRDSETGKWQYKQSLVGTKINYCATDFGDSINEVRIAGKVNSIYIPDYGNDSIPALLSVATQVNGHTNFITVTCFNDTKTLINSAIQKGDNVKIDAIITTNRSDARKYPSATIACRQLVKCDGND